MYAKPLGGRRTARMTEYSAPALRTTSTHPYPVKTAMTKKNQSSAAPAAAKKPLAKTVPAAVVEPVAPASVQSPLALAAIAWLMPDTDPRLDVADARAAVRASTGSWPTVLQLSPQVFEDLCNHPAVIQYLAAAQLQRSYDCMRGPSAKQFIGYYLGVAKVDVVPDEPAASLA